MSALGDSPQDIKHNALSLIEYQIAVTGNAPVGVLTAKEVIKIDDVIWSQIVDHVRLFGEESVCLLTDQDFSACGENPECPSLYFVGATQIASVEHHDNQKTCYIMHSEVPEDVFNDFISLVIEKSKFEKEARGEERSKVSLEKITLDVQKQRDIIENEALLRCTEIRQTADGELVGCVESEEKFGYQHDTFKPIGEDTEETYKKIRSGAKPVFSGEHKILKNVCEEYVKEKHFLGSVKFGVHAVDRLDKSNKKTKQFFIFDTPVTLNDFHRFLRKLQKIEAENKVERNKNAVESIYWAGKPKKKSAEAPVFGFD